MACLHNSHATVGAAWRPCLLALYHVFHIARMKIGEVQCKKCFYPDFSHWVCAKQSETIYCVKWHTKGTVDVHAVNTIMPFHAKESSFHVWSKEKEQPLTKWHSAKFERFWSGKEGSCRPAGYQAEAISPRSASCYGTCIKNPDTSAFLMFT